MNPITPGKYTRDQIQSMGLNFDEVTSAQNVNGRSYKLDNPGDGSRVIREVSLQNGGQGSGGFRDIGTSGAAPSMTGFNQPTIDLPSIYKNLYDNSGISDLENKLSQKEEAYNTARFKINDNPWLAEGDRIGRIAKLSDDYERAVANDKNDVARKKADIETQLGLQTKQFDINSQQAQLALNQFNTLMGMGAFDNAGGADIANITRATGLSSSMIQSAIDANKKKNVQTSTISFDDGTNQGYAIINAQTGDIINKQIVAASKPKAAGKESVAESNATKKQNDISGAQYMIQLYKNTDKKNPSWNVAHELRGAYSPEDFLAQLYVDYPYAADYIKGAFTLK